MKRRIAFLVSVFSLQFLVPANADAQGFNVTMELQMPKGTVDLGDLDLPPVVTPKSAVVYPPELARSGIVGRIHGFAILRADGSVVMLVVSHGNDERFRKPVETAAEQWTFSVPTKDSRAVGAYVQFQVVISERGNEGPYLVGPKKKPNKAPEPTP